MVLVDTSVWIDYFRGRPTPEADRLDVFLGTEIVGIGDLMLAEVLEGLASERDFNRARRFLDGLQLVDIGGRDVAVQAARNHRYLRSIGISVRKTIDTLIATRCIADQHPLLYSDRDFDPFVRHLRLVAA